MDSTPTVGYIHGGVAMVAAGDVVSKFVEVRRGGIYGSSDRTEYYGFILVNF